MQEFKDNWLPSLKNSVPPEAFGYTVSMYSIALEGWRRGLTLKFINNNQRRSEIDYSLTYKGKEREFSVTRGDIVPRKAIKICVNKDLTKKALLDAGVPTPKGETFGEESSDESIIQYSKRLGYPVVLKPSDGTGGNGVIANIKNEEEFKEALSYVKYDLNYSKLIVEKHFTGEDYRLYVIDDKVIGGFKKIPANIIGDGKNSIRYLMKKKNQERNSTPALHKRIIKVDKELHSILRSKGYTLESIPRNGEQVFLKTKNNVSAGGDSVDVTDELTDEIKNIAIKASNAIPGLVQCGVDIMVNKEENTGVILEVNSRPHITAHLYPWKGKARDIPKAIIDYYFPETVTNNDDNQPKFYFDFKSVFDAFQSGYAKEITIPDIPSGTLTATRFIVSGNIKGVNYEKWVRKQARSLKLNGYIKHLENDKSVVVVAGSKKSIEKFRNFITKKSSKRAKVTNVVEKSRKSPVKVGFEILDDEPTKASVTKTNTVANKPVKNTVSNKNKVRPANEDNTPNVSVDGYFPVRMKNPSSKSKSKKKTSSVKKRYNGSDELKMTKIDLKKVKKERDFYKKRFEAIKKSRSWRITEPMRKFSTFIKR